MIEAQTTYLSMLILSVLLLAALIASRKRKTAQTSMKESLGLIESSDQIQIAEIQQRLAHEEKWAANQYEILSQKIRAIRDPPYEQMGLTELFGHAEPGEISNIKEVLKSQTASLADIEKNIRSKGTSVLSAFWRAANKKEAFLTYDEIVLSTAKHVGLELPIHQGTYISEAKLQHHMVELVLNEIPIEERTRLLVEFAKASKSPTVGKEAMTAGALTIANLSGFGLYLASSTALGAITSAVGVTLPFAAYTGLSSALSVIIGPIGWAALGLWVAHKLGKPDPFKLISIVLLVSNLRLRLMAARDEPLPLLRHKRNKLLGEFQERLSTLKNNLARAVEISNGTATTVSQSHYRFPERPNL